jgi:hypothetical protein
MGVAEDLSGFLRERGAESIDHPGGTLYAHLVRVSERLRDLGCSADLQHAGLAHAVYGTDGFRVALLDRADRPVLQRMIGPRAELLVYRYCACDRGRTWADLERTGQVWDRFDGTTETLGGENLRAFVDLTIVNELDVLEQSPALAEQHGEELRALFSAWAPLASPSIAADVVAMLGAG